MTTAASCSSLKPVSGSILRGGTANVVGGIDPGDPVVRHSLTMKRTAPAKAVLLLLQLLASGLLPPACAFPRPSAIAGIRPLPSSPSSSSSSLPTPAFATAIRSVCDDGHTETVSQRLKSAALTASLVVALASASASPAHAYSNDDYASETVQEVVQKLKDGAGNVDATFGAYEDIASIITEGRGVGGMINYKGVALERGYIADEDTTIYNPGLTLLTESEKERLVQAVIDARKAGLEKGAWTENNEFAFEFLREKLDPYHMQELSGYLQIMPFYAAFLYLVVLGVQQFARSQFVPAYFIAVGAFFLPIIVLVKLGP